MPSRNIHLTDHYDGFIASQLENGTFQNASEVVRTALYLLEQKQAEDKARIEALRRDVMAGVKDYEEGRYIEFENSDKRREFFADVYQKIKEEIKTKSE